MLLVPQQIQQLVVLLLLHPTKKIKQNPLLIFFVSFFSFFGDRLIFLCFLLFFPLCFLFFQFIYIYILCFFKRKKKSVKKKKILIFYIFHP
jgi:hypothetical protein